MDRGFVFKQINNYISCFAPGDPKVLGVFKQTVFRSCLFLMHVNRVLHKFFRLLPSYMKSPCAVPTVFFFSIKSLFNILIPSVLGLGVQHCAEILSMNVRKAEVGRVAK